MKQDLVLSGRVELTRHEITLAINEFLKNRQLAGSKTVYLVEKDSIKGAVIDVQKSLAQDETIPFFPDLKVKEERNGKDGWRKKNIGLFAFLRDLFSEKRKGGIRKLSFDDLFIETKASFPNITEKNLKVYLYDKRQLKSAKFNSKLGEVTF